MMQSFRRASSLLSPLLHQSGYGMNGMSAVQVGSYKCFSLHSRQFGLHDRISPSYMGTTVLCVRKDDKVVVIGDGQVTLGSQIIKPNVKKVRQIGDSVIGGFAGATADSFTLFERLESKLEEHPGQLTRAAVELAKAWRTDKYLRRLDAVMVVADAEISLTITGNGDVLEPYDGVIGIGSGGSFASAAARALIDLPNMDAEAIGVHRGLTAYPVRDALKAMKIAADCCIYTNHHFTIQQLNTAPRSLEVQNEAASISNDMPPPTEGSAPLAQ